MKMSLNLLAALFVIGLPGTVLASEASCDAPVASWQSQETLRTKLQQEGWQVRRIKTDDGCYEVYGLDAEGKRAEAYFDPRSLELVRRKRGG